MIEITNERLLQLIGEQAVQISILREQLSLMQDALQSARASSPLPRPVANGEEVANGD